MKLILLERQIQAYYLCGGLLGFAVCLLLVSVSFAENADTSIVFRSSRTGISQIYRIAFTSNRNENVDIYVMDVDGANPTRLTDAAAKDRGPSWSPDGTRIAFASLHDSNSEIYVMNADGSNPQNLTNNPDPDGHPNDEDPSWSPDGAHIVFSARREGHFVHNLDTVYEIYVMDADGGNEQRLTENRNNDWNPAWSPDGNRIAFMADRKGDFVSFDIYVMDADGGNQQKLTNHRAWDGSPSWSPNGERIAFVSERDGNTEIYVMDADGGNLQNLTNNPSGDFGPAWLNSPFSVAPAGRQFTMWGRVKQVNQ